MLRLECDARSVPVHLDDRDALPADAGLRLLLVWEVLVIEDVWCGAPGPLPWAGTGTGDGGDDELLQALESEAAGLTRRDCALRLWNLEPVRPKRKEWPRRVGFGYLCRERRRLPAGARRARVREEPVSEGMR